MRQFAMATILAVGIAVGLGGHSDADHGGEWQVQVVGNFPTPACDEAVFYWGASANVDILFLQRANGDLEAWSR